jgi:hypothetical protein
VSSPVFMFGFERSGTTLLSMMMGAHPKLAVPLSVTGLWYRYAEMLGGYESLNTESALEKLVADILKEERIALWDEVIEHNDVMSNLKEKSFSGVIAAVHGSYAQKKGKPFWGNLDIVTLDEMPVANSWFPDARFVHIVRDGRDVALSHETMPYGAANTLDCAQSWDRRLTTNMQMGRMLPASRYKIIRYEDLVLDSAKTLDELCDFLDLEYSPEMLNYTEMVDGKIPEDRRWLWPALDQKPQKSKCYGWKLKMDKKRRIVFEGEAGSLLREFGYDTWNRVPKSVMGYLYEFWCFLGREGRLRRISKALGFSSQSHLQKEWSQKNGK